MIAFLQPLALLGLLAASIPPLLHLLARKLPPVVPFPAVRYLTETERKHSRRLKLRNLLLLILRTALITLIALAAARPVARVPFGGEHEPTGVGVVVDNSLSSGAVVDGRRVLDGIVNQARHVLARAGDEDHVWLVLADGLPRRVSLIEAAQVLDTLTPWPVRLDLSGAVRALSRTIEDAATLGYEIIVLSDLQATALSSDATSDPEAHLAERILLWAPPGLGQNRGVDSVRVEPGVWSPSGDVIASLGGSDDSPTTVRLTVNDRDLARSVGGRGDRVVLTASSAQSGWFVAAVRLDPDELRADDLRQLAIRVAPPAAATATEGAGRFLAEALGVLQQSGRARIGNDVTFSDRLSGGVSVIFPPADPALVGALNRALQARGIEWRFGPLVEGEWQVSGTVGAAEGTTVHRRHRLEGQGAVLGRVSSEPWLVKTGDVILVASRMEVDWASLPVSAAFVPFLDLLINRIAAAQSWIVRTWPGDVAEAPAGAQALLTPDGPIPIPGNGRFAAPLQRGVYFLQGAGTDTIGAVEVNHDPRETSLRQAERREVRATLGGAVQVLNTAGLDRELFRGARRADLTGALLMLAVFVALVEFGLSSAGGAQRRDS